ncbi:Cas9 inhibitor AcrIIA9 family protein [Lacrimispora sp.]|uniref:Cas9 inhibitor AcrIIA9 family protein n=1 Tax=Lacrimispora sp. TaxID=2719234 RepID=UPI0028ABC0BE|nr:Cas9 inhibitor AcrIIA9 family protein [Lacrimispora sp.]
MSRKARSYSAQGKKGEFIKIFNELCYSRNDWQVWADVITAIACTISNVTDRTPDKFENREKEYAECIKRLGGVEKPAQLFAIIVEAMEVNPDQDFLGSLYMELQLGNHWKGQFFTPYSVSRAMAEMTMGNCQEQIDKQGWISICDPCVGGGAMLIAAANTMRRQKVYYHDHVLFIGQDVDRVVGLMAYIQLSLLGCPGYIVIGNSLTNPILGNPLMPAEQDGQEFWYTTFYNSQAWTGRRMIHVMFPPESKKVKSEISIDRFYFFFEIKKENEIMDENVKKQFSTGAEKLEFEKTEQLKKVNAEYRDMYRQQLDSVFGELIRKCEETPAFDAAVLQEHKSWERCYRYAGKKAMEINTPSQHEKDMARSGEKPIVVAATSDMVLNWFFEYYQLDDKEQVEKEVAEKAVNNSAKKENVQKPAQHKIKAAAKVEDSINNQKVDKKKNDMEGQFSLFDMI